MTQVPSSSGNKSASSWLLATANGGIWKTDNLLSASVHWTQQLDGQPVTCTSISAMQSLGKTVLAGCGGATSSEMGYDWMVSNSGDWGGLLISHDSGATWAMTSFPANYYISAILVTSPTAYLVSARAHFLSRDDGGVWSSTDGGSSWVKTFARPVYDLVREPTSGVVLAALPWTSDAESIHLSKSGGTRDDWTAVTDGLSWDGRTPFYPTFALGRVSLFVGALTVNPSVLSDTSSAIYRLDLADLSGAWSRVRGTPRLDQDGMPKDRMALLVHPTDDSILYVAGNAGALAWRVDWATGSWEELYGSDTSDNSAPHCDCRRYFWEPQSSSLLLLSDGGAWRRDQPSAKGKGTWHSLAGDIGAMEFVSAHWDPAGKRFVGGAQDNDVVLSTPNASATQVGVGFIGGDGTLTAVDSDTSPSRLWGAVENNGFAADDEPGPGRTTEQIVVAERALVDDDADSDKDGEDEDEGACGGFGFWQGHAFVCVPLRKWFTGGQFSQFVQPWALLSTDRTQLLVYANKDSTATSASTASPYSAPGIYRLDVGYSIRNGRDIPPPALEVATDGDVNVVIAGGVTNGQPDPKLLIAMNTTHLLYRSSAATIGGSASNGLIARPLPMTFAPPVVTPWRRAVGEFVLGPMSHDRTVSLAVAPNDSSMIALSGWASVVSNSAPERVWLSTDAGASFTDVTGSLRNATKTIGQWRPSALLLLPMKTKSKTSDATATTMATTTTTALLVGTAHGVFVRFFTSSAALTATSTKARSKLLRSTPWARLGTCDQLPLVMVAGLSHEPKDDTLVAATMGRGVYVAHGAVKELEALFTLSATA